MKERTKTRLPPLILALSRIRGLLQAAEQRPNILVIGGDDVGYDNVSVYNLGMIGYQTPNIDQIAKEGALFADAYAEQTFTAGRPVAPLVATGRCERTYILWGRTRLYDSVVRRTNPEKQFFAYIRFDAPTEKYWDVS
jgi:hypothetical protein